MNQHRAQGGAERVEAPAESRAGWSVKDWCRACSISRTTLYGLDEPPASVLLGRKRIITESPAAFLARIASEQTEAA